MRYHAQKKRHTDTLTSTGSTPKAIGAPPILWGGGGGGEGGGVPNIWEVVVIRNFSDKVNFGYSFIPYLQYPRNNIWSIEINKL